MQLCNDSFYRWAFLFLCYDILIHSADLANPCGSRPKLERGVSSGLDLPKRDACLPDQHGRSAASDRFSACVLMAGSFVSSFWVFLGWLSHLFSDVSVLASSGACAAQWFWCSIRRDGTRWHCCHANCTSIGICWNCELLKIRMDFLRKSFSSRLLIVRVNPSN